MLLCHYRPLKWVRINELSNNFTLWAKKSCFLHWPGNQWPKVKSKHTLCMFACRWTGSSATAAVTSGSTKSALALQPRWLKKRTTFVSVVRWLMDIWANEGSFSQSHQSVCWSHKSGCVTDPVLSSPLSPPSRPFVTTVLSPLWLVVQNYNV